MNIMMYDTTSSYCSSEKINNNNAVGGDLLCSLASSMHTVIVEDTSCVVPRSTDSPVYSA